ncbi:hypothetical protein D1007_04618 [Hordeum vulgare]|nr:hypothetical protein D1007_04618 [Hordeum vulgare]
MGFIRELKEVQAHGTTKLHVIHTNDLRQVEAIIDWCTVFDNLLLDSRYTFVGFSIDQYIKKLNRVALHITHFVDIQKQWRVPRSTKYLDSLGDVSSMLIDDYYMSMKQKLTNEDHKRWACMPLSMKRVHYATKDAYAAYEIWSRITVTQDGLHCAMLEKTKKHGRTWGDDGW